MKRSDIAVVAGWIIILGIIGVTVTWGIFYAVGELLKFAAAVLAGAVALAGAILEHALKVERESEQQAQTQRNQLELERQRTKAGNYAELIRLIARFVRNTGKSDDFETIHLLTWVWGSPEVVRLTQEFMKALDKKSLHHLLLAMRDDVGLPGGWLPDDLGDILSPQSTGHLK